jgi:hypothetical protein
MVSRMVPMSCPSCHKIPGIMKVDRVIGELYRIQCCDIIAFGDPIGKGSRVQAFTVALNSAWRRWNEAVREARAPR